MNRSFPIRLMLALVLTSGFPAHAQRPVFGVYTTSGTVTCVPARGGGSSPVLQHIWLYPGDKLTLSDNISEIVLFDHDTSYVRLKEKGTYKMDQIGKMQHTRVHDSLMIRYLSLVWAENSGSSPAAARSTGAPPNPATGSSAGTPASHYFQNSFPTRVLAPRAGYATSLDSLIFRWHGVSWARKYFLRLRNPDGQLAYDSVIIDTQAVVHFPGRMTAPNSYTWTLDIVGEAGRLQFADSGHIVLVNESAVLPQLPAITADPIGGIAIILQHIEQDESAGCTKQANDYFQQLTADFPMDAALNQLYMEFRRRNYF